MYKIYTIQGVINKRALLMQPFQSTGNTCTLKIWF